MDAKEARCILSEFDEEDQRVALPPAILAKLGIEDVPEGVRIEVGTNRRGVLHLDWTGTIFREGESLCGEAEYIWTRKYWYSPLGLEQYLDLVRRSVETRHRTKGDVELTHFDDDGAFIALSFRVRTDEKNLAKAHRAIKKIAAEVEEAAEEAAAEVGQRIAEVAARLSGWGSESLDGLIDAVESAKSADDRGRSLEELCSRLFSSVPGFSVTGRVRTETEEIDISVVNDSTEPRLRREGALVLAECKNWSGKCGKDEFVLFHQKLENRSGRCTLGFLISWERFYPNSIEGNAPRYP
jgi:hypothetical protein